MKKIMITTTYSDVTDEWINWYCRRLISGGLEQQGLDLIAKNKAIFESKDPTSDVNAKTVYEITDD